MSDITKTNIYMTMTGSKEKIDEYLKREFLTAHYAMREGAKNEGRKEVWDMVRRLYLNDVLENAYSYAELKKVFGTISFSELLQKDVHEMLAKDKEHLKRIEEEKIIRPGDEVEVDTDSPWHSGVCYGWVVDIHGETVHILISTEYGIEMRYVGLGICRKTGNTAEHLSQLIKAMKEEK